MKPLIKKIYHLFTYWIVPRNRFGDNFIAFITFLRAHRRLPSSNLLFNDVLYKIKTSDEIIDPLRVFVSDKEFVKIFVKAVAGEQYNVPSIKVLHSIEEAKNYQYSSDCCIKPTHLSGTVILRRQNGPINFEEIDSWFKSSHYLVNRETNYKTLKPKVIVEPLIFGSDNLSDYKFFCYQGKPKLIQMDVDRYNNHSRKFFDLNWNELPFSLLYPHSNRTLDRPKNLDKMLEVASLLSSYFNFVRIDLYSNGDECLVGEITNCHGNAWESFIPLSAEKTASELIFGSV